METGICEGARWPVQSVSLPITWRCRVRGQRPLWPCNLTSVLISVDAREKNYLWTILDSKLYSIWAHFYALHGHFCDDGDLWDCVWTLASPLVCGLLVRVASLEGGQAVTDRFSGWWRGGCSLEQKKHSSIGSQRLFPSYWLEAVSPCTLCPHERSGAPLISPVSQWQYASSTKSLWKLHNFKGHHT